MRSIPHPISAIAIALILCLLVAGIAAADAVQNDVTAAGNGTVEEGGTTQIGYRIAANSGDGENGCNATVASPAVLTVVAPTGVTVTPPSLTFTSCANAFQSVAMSSAVAGSYKIEVTITDGGPGTYNLNPAKLDLIVTPAAPPPPPPVLDATAPVVISSVEGTLGQDDWYTDDVTVSWSVTDPESAFTTTGCETVVISADQAATDYTCTAVSEGGTTSETVSVKRDATAPVVTLVGGPSGTVYATQVPATATCTAVDALSGAGPCTVTGYATTVGDHTLTGTASDAAGNVGTATRSYTVAPLTLRGFYAPVDMGGVQNVVKAGSTVPIKFELFAGPTELTDASLVHFSVSRIACASGAVSDEVEVTTAGATMLRYDTVGGQFVQNWKVPAGASGTCYLASVTSPAGGSAPLTAVFRTR